jgi:hypothetical protein
MRIKATLTLALALVVVVPGLGAADTSAVRTADLDGALTASTAQEDAAREQVRALLAREDVRELAEAAGLDLRRAEAAVAALSDEELQRVVQQAAAADKTLAGGQMITISLVTALLIVLLIVLLVD